MQKNRLYSISIRNRKKNEQGLFISEGENWFVIKSLLCDYIIDGYKIINKQYISSIKRTDENIFIEEVLRSNNRIKENEEWDIPLETQALFKYLYENNILFKFYMNKEHSFYVGSIHELLKKSFYLDPIGKKGNRLDYYLLFRMDFTRVIAIDTNYINSLISYNRQLTSQ